MMSKRPFPKVSHYWHEAELLLKEIKELKKGLDRWENGPDLAKSSRRESAMRRYQEDIDAAEKMLKTTESTARWADEIAWNRDKRNGLHA